MRALLTSLFFIGAARIGNGCFLRHLSIHGEYDYYLFQLDYLVKKNMHSVEYFCRR
jgi:hypothetical protein